MDIDHLRDMIDSEVPGLGVIVFKDGRELCAKFFGSRRLGTNQKPVTRQTRFRIASVSKMFTAFAIMQLVERGKISLDSDAGDLLGFELRNPNQPNEKISVRMLASHTSSIRDGKIYSLPPEVSVAELFKPDGAFWEDGKHFASRNEKVGEFFTYSNLNYGLLGTIIEAVTGKRFDVYQRENIFSPLDIKADYLPANFYVEEFENLGALYREKTACENDNKYKKWFAQLDNFCSIHIDKDTVALENPYSENFNRVCSLEGYRVGTNATFFSPQGGLRISFDELANALEMILHGGNFRGRRILSRQSLETMFKPHWTFNPLKPNGDTSDGAFLSYGLGTYRVDFQSTTLLGHGGEAFGMLSGLFVIPRTRSGFAYMMNGHSCAVCSNGLFVCEEKIFDAVTRLLENHVSLKYNPLK